MLEIKNLSKSFGKKKALDDFTFTFENGIYGLLGPNGSGKTTLIRCITELYTSKKGQILYNSIPSSKSREFLTNIGYLPQNFGMFKDLTVKEMLELFANLKNMSSKAAKQSIEEVLKEVNLYDKLNSRISSLSGGMIRRLGIAQALLGDPKIIIFDEPTVGLDPEERLRFKSIISKIAKDKIIIISTHIVEDVEALCNHIIIIKSGKIIEKGSNVQISYLAKDKVYVVPKSELEKIGAKYEVIKLYSENNENFARLLCNEVLDYEKPELTVEDGYMYAIKRYENVL